MKQLSLSTEFDGLIRHELDVEVLLRRSLEFVLAHCGATNAAVFLPTTSGDYTLGAYVNYDCPKDTIDILLDHLANCAAPRLIERDGILHVTDREGLAHDLGDEAGWLGESHAVGLACRADGEPLAVILLFRDSSTPFTPAVVTHVGTIGELFAAQLARVIRIHHRHMPKDQWGAIGDPVDGGGDDDGLTA
jgi:hypothetical protein